MSLPWLLIGASLGLLVGFVLGSVYWNVTNARPPHARSRASDGGADVAFVDPYCNQTFADEEKARDHAIKRHNAPRDGSAWRQTYKEPGET